jgi:hypothetical protein
VGGDAQAGGRKLRICAPRAHGAVATAETSFAAIWNAEDKDHAQAAANVFAAD